MVFPCGSHPPVQIANIVVQIAVVPCRAWIFRIARWALQAAKSVFVQTMEQIKVFALVCVLQPARDIFFCRLCKERSDLALSVDVGVN